MCSLTADHATGAVTLLRRCLPFAFCLAIAAPGCPRAVHLPATSRPIAQRSAEAGHPRAHGSFNRRYHHRQHHLLRPKTRAFTCLPSQRQPNIVNNHLMPPVIVWDQTYTDPTSVNNATAVDSK